MRFSVAFSALVLALSAVHLAHAADPSGTFVRPSTGTQINFYSCGGGLCGRIVAVKDASKQSTVGTVILNGARKTGDNKWQGELLNTEDGKTYAGHVTMESANAVKLEGCALGGLVCKGETWTRVK